MLGPEIATTMPISAIGIHGPSSMNLPKMPTATALRLPSATPIAATVPTSVLRSPGASVGAAVGLATSDCAWVDRPAVTPLSWAAARLATCSSIMRRNFL